MSRYLSVQLAMALMLCASPVFAQAKATAQNVPEIPYDSVPNFLKMPPGLYLGEAIGVATNSKGHVFVYTRSANTRLFEFDQNGKYVREIGEGATTSSSRTASASIRRTTSGSSTRARTSSSSSIPKGTVMMVLGRRPAEPSLGMRRRAAGPPPPARSTRFGRPTDVAWDPQGNIFVSDGYINHRVVKFDKNGRFLKQVGSEKPGSEPSQFSTPHGIAVDVQGNVYVADRAQQPDAGVRQQPGARRRSTTTSAIRGRSASRRARTSICSPRTRTRTAIRPGRGTSPARSTRWSWTGRSSAGSATPASSSAASRWCT